MLPSLSHWYMARSHMRYHVPFITGFPGVIACGGCRERG